MGARGEKKGAPRHARSPGGAPDIATVPDIHPVPEAPYELAEGIATITFARPENLNAWTPGMDREIRRSILAAERDPAVRLILLTGNGQGFCAGESIAAPDQAPRVLSARSEPTDRYGYMLEVGKPLVAAINGPVAGVGLCIALFCDLRFMVEGTELTADFARNGRVAEYGAAWILPRLVGAMDALDLLLSGRTIDTAEAARMGLVRSLPRNDFLGSVRDQLRPYLLASPRSMRVIKNQIYFSFDQDIRLAMEDALRARDVAMQSQDFKEASAAVREGRCARFTGH